ncbi:MAG: peptide chain release factor 2 [Syntrophobacteraceae bacterium CG23_combo_of_CG06-09_8_20_14_all_50_8]|nr:MAG: peptide chain release factor 2 [Syntrophobacteraceae bacterium CG23_combo_of_CG06-09_8_20_14_all_50_8]
MLDELNANIVDMKKRIEKLRNCLDIANKEYAIADMEKLSVREDFWNDKEKASEVLKEKTKLLNIVDNWKRQKNSLDEIESLFELATEENDDKTLNALGADLGKLNESVRSTELKRMLGSDQDPMNSIMSIHAGAGGTEAQDWAEMLLRMYLRWADKKVFKATIIDYQPGDEAGIKSVSLTLEGPYAYGYSKAEIGIHRLVRVSPFDAGARRHTSFASVFVYPQVDDSIVVEIDENDLRIDTYRATGAGGQHVNKTDSAVRISHLPTGVVVQCQNERSQHKNKAMAMKFLKSRLYEIKLREQNERMLELNKTKKDIAWGSQIRSYVLHPYKIVKDHRTNLEVGNVARVLDGEIDDFIESYLLQ